MGIRSAGWFGGARGGWWRRSWSREGIPAGQNLLEVSPVFFRMRSDLGKTNLKVSSEDSKLGMTARMIPGMISGMISGIDKKDRK